MKKNKPKKNQHFSAKSKNVTLSNEHLLPQSENKRNTMINYQFSTIHYQLFFFAFLILLPGCKCKKDCDDAWNPDCSNYDPCYGVEETSADFICYAAPLATYQDSFRVTLFATDTVYTWGALFETKQAFDSVKWKVGLEPEYRNSSSCYVHFGEKPSDRIGPIQVTCILYRQSSASCHPEDDGIDTVTRTIMIASLATAPIYGTYRGKFITEDYFKDTFDVTLRYDSSYSTEWVMMDSLDRDLPVSLYNRGIFYNGNRIVSGGTTKGSFDDNKVTISFNRGYRSSYYRQVTGDWSKNDKVWVGYKL